MNKEEFIALLRDHKRKILSTPQVMTQLSEARRKEWDPIGSQGRTYSFEELVSDIWTDFEVDDEIFSLDEIVLIAEEMNEAPAELVQSMIRVQKSVFQVDLIDVKPGDEEKLLSAAFDNIQRLGAFHFALTDEVRNRAGEIRAQQSRGGAWSNWKKYAAAIIAELDKYLSAPPGSVGLKNVVDAIEQVAGRAPEISLVSKWKAKLLKRRQTGKSGLFD